MVTIDQLRNLTKSLNLLNGEYIHNFVIKDYEDEYGAINEHYILTLETYDWEQKRAKTCLIRCDVVKAFINEEVIIWPN